jgi:formyltetrahydrofolate synthetase
VAKGLEPSETTTTKEEEEEEEEDANEKARKEVAKGLEQSAKAFKHASEIILMAGGEGAKARSWAKDTSTSLPLRVDVDDDDAGEEKENTKTTREERCAVERKMEEIAKRVYAENETKTRARERLAVVDTILEVLKDTGDGRKGGGDA